MQLSKRLQTIAGMVSETVCFADIGTDHGYMPIDLIERGICQRAIAMDVRTGPLERAREHIAKAHLERCIETRLSDGVDALKPGEAQTVLIAGMGGNLVLHILQNGAAVIASLSQLILQPQSEIAAVRSYVDRQGWTITEEEMVLEDGKYYPMMQIDVTQKETGKLQEVERRYGPCLLKSRHPVLLSFLNKELYSCEQIISRLDVTKEAHRVRRKEVELDRQYVLEALHYFQ